MTMFAIVLAALVFGVMAPALAVDFYVAPNGNDAWSGRRPSPSANDGPFGTLERAREAVRPYAGRKPVTVHVRGGVYHRSATFALGSADSGASGRRVVYRAYRNETPVLSGGRTVGGWRSISDPAVLQRLPEAVRTRVLCADLRAQGITDFGEMNRRGFGPPVTPMGLEVFYRGKRMNLARWPNDGWTTIRATPGGQQGGSFTFSGGNPQRWRNTTDIWVHGYWTYDWADTYEKVATLDPTSHTVTTAPPHGVYGYTPGKRFYFLNILEELDTPGEWWLDRERGILYFYPPDTPGREDLIVSVMSAPMIRMQDASWISLDGLAIRDCRGLAVEVNGGTEVDVRRMSLSCIGGSAMRINGGSAHTVRDCHLHELGESGIEVSGGDRSALTPGRHQILRNHIHDYSQICRTYRPAVLLNGVGNRVANNAIHDAPHNAILFSGNDHTIEYNDISRVCLQTGDAGAIYAGRNMTMRGTVIRWNYFHDISRVIGESQNFVDVMSVYLDDCFCGTTVYGNVFVRAGRAAMIGGGRDNTIENNVFVDCNPAVHVDSRGAGWASFWFDGRDPFIMNGLKEVHHDQPPYASRYPQLVDLLRDQPGRAKGNVIARNVSVGGKWLEMLDGLTDKEVRFEANLTEGDPGFYDLAGLDFRLRSGSPLRKLGFKAIPTRTIGLPNVVPTPWAGKGDAPAHRR
ncbi:MAG: right-handed parallel beta-helix repeat-containing protein [Chthonomonadales bacterium]|nr:right-handed parallel beta-helix repeat-containing protein [Chthonomonadales bacterium]